MTQLSIERETALKEYLKVVATLPRANSVQRLSWLDAWKQGQVEAGRQLLESFLPMVVAEAAARRGLGARFEALLEAGNKALAEALPLVCEHPRTMEAALQRSVVEALKRHWMKAAEKGRNQGHLRAGL